MLSDTDPIVEFKGAAERFISLMDAARPSAGTELRLALLASLSWLYSAALSLPDPEPSSIDADEHGMSHEDWRVIYERTQRVLGDDHYWTVVPFGDDADDEPREHLVGSVADDLADIFRDLTDGFTALAEGAPESDVVWGWRRSFWTHWGEHAVNALRIIHARLTEDSHM